MANIIKPKRSNTAAKVPNTTELTSGELGVNMADRKVYINNGTAVVQVGAGNLSGLGDVSIASPANGQSLAYNSTTSKWENTAGGAGTVTSVGITPGTGVTVSGSPITTSGNIDVGLSTKLTAIENLSGAGFFTQNGSGVIARRTLQAGTGISIAHGNGSSQDPTITNSAPDQTVALTQGGATTITGTYPNFTISSVNTTYSLATSTVLGLIELGSDTQQTVASNAVTATASRSYALQVNAAGQGVVNVPWTDTTYTLPAATSTIRGGIELNSDTAQTVAANAVTATASRTYGLQVNADGQGVINVPWTDTVYSLPAATSTIRGGIELGSDTAQTVAANAVSATASRSYALQVNADGQGVVNVPWTDTNSGGTVTSVGGTGTVSGLTLTGTVTTSGNLTLGGTLAVTPSNFASQTANTVLAAPNGAAGVPTFRAIVAADIPTLNQNTTGTAANVTGTVAIANGGTGATTAANALTNLGAYAASNPSAYINTAGARSALSFTAGSGAYNSTTGVITIPTNTNQLTNGAGFVTSSGVTSVATGTGLTGGTITTTGTISLANTAVTAGSYTSANFTVDAQGRITAASNGSAAAIGSNTQVAYNNAGTMAGSANLTFNGTNLTCGGTITANSDESLKTNWRDLPDNFVDLLALVKSGTYDRIDQELTQDGVSAQSLQPLLPNSVLLGEDGKLSVAYGNAALVACIKLAQRVLALEQQLKAKDEMK